MQAKAKRFELVDAYDGHIFSYDTFEEALEVFPIEGNLSLIDHDTQFEWLSTCDVPTAKHLYETYVLASPGRILERHHVIEDTAQFDFDKADDQFLIHIVERPSNKRYCDGAEDAGSHGCKIRYMPTVPIPPFCAGCGQKHCPACVAKRNFIKGFNT